MTVVYQDYYKAYDNGEFDVNNIWLNVKLVSDDYIPDPSHKPIDVKKYIINGVGTLIKNDVATLPMSSLIYKSKIKIEAGLREFPEEIKAEIDRVFGEEAEKLKSVIDNPVNLWEDLRSNGIGYFVVEMPSLNILCWSEKL